METFETPSDKGSYAEYDTTGQLSSCEKFDPEAQLTSQDFKQ